jgi:hypothetical protein
MNFANCSLQPLNPLLQNGKGDFNASQSRSVALKISLISEEDDFDTTLYQSALTTSPFMRDDLCNSQVNHADKFNP